MDYNSQHAFPSGKTNKKSHALRGYKLLYCKTT
ncbi:hypothetical protein HNQ55_001604 [Thalassotalea piscium]|uniref:Uncharacterized protein n=1 Tax=Thalassotalea piscium TaxID=1230533 RepID=A0A7X0NGL7_9GAMM|nr:hypothetical protein [Thalassotalea piscium]